MTKYDPIINAMGKTKCIHGFSGGLHDDGSACTVQFGVDRTRPPESDEGISGKFERDQAEHNRDMVEWRERVERKQQENDQRINALAQQGAMVDPLTLLRARVLRLTDELLGDMNSAERLGFEERLADEYTRDLRAAEGEVRKAILLRGVNGRPQG